MRSLSALLLVFATASACAQGAYRWVGKDGKIHYSDSAPLPAEVQKIETKRLQASTIDSGGKLSYAARQAALDFPVTLFTTPECGPVCKQARDFLAARGIPFAEKTVATPEAIADYKKATASEALSVPTLLVGVKTEKGFEAGAWGGLLTAAGYPEK